MSRYRLASTAQQMSRARIADRADGWEAAARFRLASLRHPARAASSAAQPQARMRACARDGCWALAVATHISHTFLERTRTPRRPPHTPRRISCHALPCATAWFSLQVYSRSRTRRRTACSQPRHDTDFSAVRLTRLEYAFFSVWKRWAASGLAGEAQFGSVSRERMAMRIDETE